MLVSQAPNNLHVVNVLSLMYLDIYELVRDTVPSAISLSHLSLLVEERHTVPPHWYNWIPEVIFPLVPQYGGNYDSSLAAVYLQIFSYIFPIVEIFPSASHPASSSEEILSSSDTSCYLVEPEEPSSALSGECEVRELVASCDLRQPQDSDTSCYLVEPEEPSSALSGECEFTELVASRDLRQPQDSNTSCYLVEPEEPSSALSGECEVRELVASRDLRQPQDSDTSCYLVEPEEPSSALSGECEFTELVASHFLYRPHYSSTSTQDMNILDYQLPLPYLIGQFT